MKNNLEAILEGLVERGEARLKTIDEIIDEIIESSRIFDDRWVRVREEFAEDLEKYKFWLENVTLARKNHEEYWHAHGESKEAQIAVGKKVKESYRLRRQKKES